MINHRVMRWVVAFGVGLAVSLYAFQRISDPQPGIQRAREEAVVRSARSILIETISPDSALELVDPLAPDRKVGKVYVYPTGSGWEVSGHYRRGPADDWHPFLMQLDDASTLVRLAVRDSDARLTSAAAEDPKLTVTP